MVTKVYRPALELEMPGTMVLAGNELRSLTTLQAVQRKDSYAASELVRPEKAT